MSTKSSNAHYGSVAIAIHWVSALLIITVLGLGFRAGQTIDPVAKASLLQIHIPLAILVFILTLFRIVWWWRFDQKPAPAGNDPRWQQMSAKAIHVAFYVIILGMAASGIGMMVLSGAGPIIFGGAQGVLPDFHSYLPRTPHGLGARLMSILLILHAGAALYHHFIRRDITLKRMWFGKADPS